MYKGSVPELLWTLLKLLLLPTPSPQFGQDGHNFETPKHHHHPPPYHLTSRF